MRRHTTNFDQIFALLIFLKRETPHAFVGHYEKLSDSPDANCATTIAIRDRNSDKFISTTPNS